MSNHQPNVWQTAGRGRHSQSASRTPQNRSGTASPAQTNPSQPPKDNPTSAPRGQAAQNVWAQRANAAGNSSSSGNGGSNGPPQPRNEGTTSSSSLTTEDQVHVPANGFNASEVKAFLAREPAPAAYKLPEAPAGTTTPTTSGGSGGNGNNRSSGGAWGGAGGAKASHMANNQPFFTQLAKQLAAFEGGG